MKNYYFIILFLLTSTLNSFAQVGSPAYELILNGLLSNSINEISVKEASSQINSVTFLDTRSPQEYQISHIKNAIWVGYEDFKLDKVNGLSKDEKIILYCSVGYRSEKIGEKLKEAGYTRVYNLYGGIFEWVNQGMNVYNQKGITNEVHPYDKFWGVWLNKGQKVYE